MARVLLVKPFTGLHLAVCQLSAELRRAGHQTRVVFFKSFVAVPTAFESQYVTPPYPARGTFARADEWIWNAYSAMTDDEYALLLEEIRSFNADLVGLSVISSAMPLAAELTDRLHADVAVPIIWGGVGPTVEPEKAIAHADLVCVGEGEDALVEIAARLDKGQSLHDIGGVWARAATGNVFRNGHTEAPDFERIAAPDFETQNHVYIDGRTRQGNYYSHWAYDQYIIMTQRGCPFSCSFCVESRYQEVFGKAAKVRRRSVDVVIDELVQARERLGFRSVMFYDDVFTIHRRWLAEFADKYAQRVGLPFWCYTYPTTTRRDDIRMLRDAGLASMTIGLQSGSQRILDEYFNRPAPLERAIDAADIIMSEGITLYFDMISKVAWETEDDLRETVNLLMKFPRGIKLVGVGYMVSYPTYDYSNRVAAEQPASTISDELYDYYHRLYILAVSGLPFALRHAIAQNPVYRKEPKLLDPFMPRQIDYHYLLNDDQRKARRAAQRTIDLGFAQAVLPDHSPAAPAQMRSSVTAERSITQRRLPLLAQ